MCTESWKTFRRLVFSSVAVKCFLLCDAVFPGHPTQWQNMTLAGIDGLAQGRVGKNSVSVLVDHF